MSCPCCGYELELCKISYDIYPLIPPKKTPFLVSLFKKPAPMKAIKKEIFACEECFSSENRVSKSGIPYEGMIIAKLKKENPGMIVCHIERIPDKEKFVEKIEVSGLPKTNQQKGLGSSALTSEDFLEKFF